MGILTELAKDFAKGYVSERGVQGTMEDAASLMKGVGNVGKKLFGSNGEENGSDEEKEYQEELKVCLEDGTISDRERRLLDRLRKSLGISEERAKAIENRLI